MEQAAWPRLTRAVDFDPLADLERIAGYAAAWRSQFRPAEVTYTPAHFQRELEELEQAGRLALYLVTRPQAPLPLAILDPFPVEDLLLLLALAPNEPEAVRPFLLSPHARRGLMRGAPADPAGRGVFPFLLGRPRGLAWLDLEAEGLTLALARWGGLNVLDPSPLLAQRVHRLGLRLGRMARPEE
ncbi:MAG: hypothetical protein LDL11_06235 [Desulfarculus sp.]|nr:hypothetical protein [Desulfarculus sp.]